MPHLKIDNRLRSVAPILCALSLLAGCGGQSILAQSGLSGPPENASRYSLVWEDYFATDTSNSGGELRNVVGSSSNPSRPDWVYRSETGPVGGCTLGQAANVYLGTSASLSGLVLHDTASGSDGQGNYLTYNCGGIITTRWLQYGYYETKAYIGTSTSYVGFHTSFWMAGRGKSNQPVADTELDIFEDDSHGQTSFSHGLYYHNIKSTDAIPSPHYSYSWSSLSPASVSSPHIFGFLWMPSGIKFYLDGKSFDADQTRFPLTSGMIPATGSFAPQNIWLTSVGSTNNSETGNCSAHTGPCLPTSDPSSYDFVFEYVKYYQPVLSAQPIVPIPSNAILIDPNAPSSGTTSFSRSGSWQQYIAGLPVSGVTTNANVKFGPQGFLGQDVWTSTASGDTATWSHTFSAADSGSYDLYVWNTTAHRFELATSTSSSPQLAQDSASLTSYTVQDVYGSTTTNLASSVIIPQGTTTQGWASLPPDQISQDNTYVFQNGHTATVTLTVGSETADPTYSVYPHTNAESVAFVPVYTFGVSGSAYTDTGFSASSLTGWAGSASSRYSSTQGSSASATWTAAVPAAGVYTLSVWVPQDPNKNSSTVAFYTVSDGTNSQIYGPIDQQGGSNQWIQLTPSFTSASSTITVTVTNGNSGNPSHGYLRANALKLTPQVSADYIVCTGSTGFDSVALFSQTAGTWSSAGGGYSGCGTNQERVSSSLTPSAVFTPQVPVGGLYHAYLYNDSSLDASSTVTVTSHSSVNAVCGSLTKTGANSWIYLGDYYFAPDVFRTTGTSTSNDHITVTGTGGSVAVSAIKLTYASERGTKANECTNN